MIDSIKQKFEVYSNALGLRNKRNEILASNIANAATPNFKARDINFEVELSRALNEGPMNTSSKGHFSLASKNLPNKIQYRQSLNPSMDGNTVELSVEQGEFAENSIRYQTTLNFINSKLSGYMSAIRGE